MPSWPWIDGINIITPPRSRITKRPAAFRFFGSNVLRRSAIFKMRLQVNKLKQALDFPGFFCRCQFRSSRNGELRTVFSSTRRCSFIQFALKALRPYQSVPAGETPASQHYPSTVEDRSGNLLSLFDKIRRAK